ncbi:MAG: hypothetical protein M1831_000832 [Alyxoria varia]|nr:MAG: hypothetical protein M1831_000832 [Alyxoria varia]
MSIRSKVLTPRDEDNAGPSPKEFSPSLQWDGNDGQWSTFSLQVGRPAQNVRVLPSTGIPETWVIDGATACPEGIPLPTGQEHCDDARGRLFHKNESITWIKDSSYELVAETNLGLDSTGIYGWDDITLGWQGSGGPSENHQVIAAVADPKYWLGVFGLDPRPSNFSDFNSGQPSFLDSLKKHNKIPSLSWAYTAGAYYRQNHVPGSLILGGYDQSLVDDNYVNIDFDEDPSNAFMTGVQDIKSNATSDSLLPGGGIYSLLDSTIPWIYLPVSACKAFEEAFNLKWNPTWELYLVDSDQHESLSSQNPSITFTLGSSTQGGSTVDITLPYAAFDLNASWPLVNSTRAPYVNQTRYFPLRQAANETQYTLGRTLLQETYVIADYERRNFTVSPRPWSTSESDRKSNIVAITSPSSSSDSDSDHSGGLSAGAIAGIVLGGVAALSLVGALFFFLGHGRRKKRIEKSTNDSTDQESTKEKLDNHTLSGGHSPEPSARKQLARPDCIETDSRERFELPSPRVPSEMTGAGLGDDKKLSGQTIVQRQELEFPTAAQTLNSPMFSPMQHSPLHPSPLHSPSEMEATPRFELVGDSPSDRNFADDLAKRDGQRKS